jgi:hypothetical protein
VYTEKSGYNGAGGYWVKGHWRWSSGGTHHTDIRFLNFEQSRQLEKDIDRGCARMSGILTITLPVPVPIIKTIPR